MFTEQTTQTSTSGDDCGDARHLTVPCEPGSPPSTEAGTCRPDLSVGTARADQDAGPDAPAQPGTPRFVVTSLFLRECYAYLMQGAVENLHYISGIVLGSAITLARLVPFKLAVQRTCYVRGNIVSSTAALMRLTNLGLPLTGHGHCHPGEGESATYPSLIDHAHQGRLEDGGYTVIGMIMVRDGHFRFFSHRMPFTVDVYGKDVIQLGEANYRLDLDFAAE